MPFHVNFGTCLNYFHTPNITYKFPYVEESMRMLYDVTCKVERKCAKTYSIHTCCPLCEKKQLPISNCFYKIRLLKGTSEP